MHWIFRSMRPARLLPAFAGLFIAAMSHAQATTGQILPAQLVREVVFNELSDHQGHGYWRYSIERHESKETLIEDQVETSQGPVFRLTQSNGQPLNNARRQQDEARIRHLLESPSEQERVRRTYEEDERRVGRILALLGDAFLYEDQGMENGLRRLAYRPNPNYPPRSIEARVFHGMKGTVWIDQRMKRLVRLDGQVAENVDFGFGILGRLYKGGWFRMERRQVSPTEWKTVRMEMHVNVRALLVKSFTKETSETRWDFTPVPSSLSLAQGAVLLERQEASSGGGGSHAAIALVR